MSHFTVLVALPKDSTGSVEENIERILEPYYENRETPSYIKYTKQELIEKERSDIREYAETGYYAQYLKDPEKYVAESRNPGHLKYLGVAEEIYSNVFPPEDPFAHLFDKKREEPSEEEKATEYYRLGQLTFPEKLARIDDDELMFKLATRFDELKKDSVEDEEDSWSVGNGLDEEGNLWSTYNPKSKWDWWVIGGRWDKKLNSTASEGENFNGYNSITRNMLTDVETAITFAYVDKDGEWHERGKMGWWAMVSDEKEEELWTEQMKDFINSLDGGDWLVVVDCHI